ncbi:hypothetical protein K491DRAFT_761531 [Lophiostoma macrostomum CBS 122681]|uniref:BTB domain-containing protein n=1 Tax=Lophiostoma macrostomum CBS 122681 TaxID=1314788 RepID=A0A6A6SSJ3_9PLEO|nr:hypothetical protein K491DRAFT_761531 [Lophiostoma macrostomum CBS 122681]
MAPIKSARVLSSEVISFDPSTILTVIVGSPPKQRSFAVHEGVICARSDFFRRAMNGDWSESQQRLVTLSAEDPDVFGVYLTHVYTGRLPSMNGQYDISPLPENLNGGFANEYQRLGEVYVLCEQLQDREGKNAVVLAILAMAQHNLSTDCGWILPSDNTVANIYDGTTKGNKARSLLVDLYTNATSRFVADGADNLPKEFLHELSVALLETGNERSVAARKSDGQEYLEPDERVE